MTSLHWVRAQVSIVPLQWAICHPGPEPLYTKSALPPAILPTSAVVWTWADVVPVPHPWFSLVPGTAGVTWYRPVQTDPGPGLLGTVGHQTPPLHTPDTENTLQWYKWLTKSLATQLFVQQLVQANNKGFIKCLYYWPFVRGINCSFSLHKGPVMHKVLPCRNLFMIYNTIRCQFTTQENSFTHLELDLMKSKRPR